MILTTLSLLSLAAWIFLTCGRGRFWQLEMLPEASEPDHWPGVVAIVPARNEAGGIGACVEGLLNQAYAGAFRLVVVNDHSDDSTAEEARKAAAQSSRQGAFTLIDADDLPEGWAGKVWAMHQGVTRGGLNEADTYLWFTDADIYHDPRVLRRLVAESEADGLTLNSRMVMLQCKSLWERLLIPAFVHFFRLLYPFRLVNDPRQKLAGAAGGCMLVQRNRLAQAGGLEQIRDRIIDDCSLAALLKPHGPIRLLQTKDSRSLRGYDGPDGIEKMIRRTAYTQLNHSPAHLVGCLLGLGVVFFVPVLGTMFWDKAAMVAWLILSLTYVPMLRYYGQPAWQAVFLPAVALLYLKATMESALAYHRGEGGNWKGRNQA
ncbi:MAG: glycosyltransferase [Verrucomicrobiota bacterium]